MYRTFHDAAITAGYLENDREWKGCLLDSSYERMSYQLCQLYVQDSEELNNIFLSNGTTFDNNGVSVLKDYREEADANEQDK
ncbi:hypothetical protein PHMEG_00015224 [Phytophthora megakarya]|uniref:Helitron helicase n=1 Tax=Phytophthora megakarya TaxID=4795 RepID=A0A225W2D7_9STRA|nr:hypothetical protein PHMEG_00015224 [Phytophthora megakarya]